MSQPTPWYHVPLLWFALVLLLAIIAACIHMVLFSIQHQDPALPEDNATAILGMPVATQAEAIRPDE